MNRGSGVPRTRFWFLLLGLTSILWLAPSAAHAAPTLTAGYDADHHLTASWQLQPGHYSYVIEWSLDPGVDPQGGGFLEPYDYALLGMSQTFFSSQDPLLAGTYYVHVASYPTTCNPDLDPCLEFSPTATVTIPARPSVAPTLVSAGHSGGYLTASWTLAPGMTNWIIETATDPTLDADGYFLIDNVVEIYGELTGDQTSWVSETKHPPGTYYVHLSAFQLDTCEDDECLEFSQILPVTVTADPVSPGPAGPTGPSKSSAAPTGASVTQDKKTAFASLKTTSKQDVDKLTIQCSMAEAGTLSATGTINVPGASKLYKFKKASVSATAGKAVKLKLKLPKKALRAVKKALGRKKKLKAKLTITAKDKAGNAKVEKRTVSLKP